MNLICVMHEFYVEIPYVELSHTQGQAYLRKQNSDQATWH